MEKKSYHELIDGKMPPWIHRLIKQAGRSINTYGMIRSGDRILLAVSGGKDSLALALAVSLRKVWLPIDYHLEGVLINWREHPIPQDKLDNLHSFFDALKIPLKIIHADMFSQSFKGDFNCYLCSRNRRRILFTEADQRDFKIVAMGHHMDDLVETTLINLCFRGNYSTMLPVQEFFSGKLHIIRPLIEVKEHALVRLAQEYDLPVAKPVCPFDQTNIRSKLKPVIRELAHIDKLTREHIFKAHEFTCRIPRDEYEGHRSGHEHYVQETDSPSA